MEIFVYWAGCAGVSVADRVIERITAKFKLLAEHSMAGKPAGHIAAKVRCFPAGKYLIYYRKTRPSLEVLYIFHSARDQKPRRLENCEQLQINLA
jgi:plasmid stabilization system protein ParE